MQGVYDDCSVNVNDDVKFLHISRESKMEMNVAALGTVEHCQVDSRGNVLKDMYNVKAGALKFVKGEDKTDAAAYSTTPTGTPASSGSASTGRYGLQGYSLWTDASPLRHRRRCYKGTCHLRKMRFPSLR